MDKFYIDSTKMKYHPGRIGAWMDARDSWETAKGVYPIYVEISPVGACNHRCTFCAVDYLGYQSIFFDKEVLCRSISEMGRAGVKSIMFAGEGEPLLHKQMADIVNHTKACGVDVSFTTNAVMMNEKFLEAALNSISWIKVSLNAGSKEDYAAIHNTKESDFEKVFGNLAHAVALRRKLKSDCALGAQMVLLPDNAAHAIDFVSRCRDTGLDYAVIKPYSQHLSSHTRKYNSVNYEDMLHLKEQLVQLETDSFKVVFRLKAMERFVKQERHYKKCLSTPFFWAYLMANGDLYGCSAYLKNDKFNYGNVHQQSFGEIWEGEKRRLNFEEMRGDFDLSNCRLNCRMESVNQYLDELVHPPEHVNFI